jgi:hypothetical protein
MLKDPAVRLNRERKVFQYWDTREGGGLRTYLETRVVQQYASIMPSAIWSKGISLWIERSVLMTISSMRTQETIIIYRKKE